MKKVIKLDIGKVKPGMRLAQTVYTNSRTVLLDCGQIINAEHIKRLVNYEISRVVVEDDSVEDEVSLLPTDEENSQDYISDLQFSFQSLAAFKPGKELTKAQLSEERELSQNYQNSHCDLTKIIQTTFQALEHNGKVDFNPLRNAVKELIDELQEEMNIRQQPTSLDFEDDYIYMHSVNVAVYSLIIGLALKLTTDELIELGVSALLHDVGMLKIPPMIRLKNQQLSQDEYNEAKKHSKLGKEILTQIPHVSPRILDAVFQHHERVDGLGYPDGLTRDKISPFARIIAISDTFDSLSSPRPYKKALPKNEAIKACLEMCMSCFDEKYLEMFLYNLPLYPVGTRIKLNNGDIGFVSKATKNPFRPCVDVTDSDNQHLDEKRRVNLALSENSILEITEVLNTVHEKQALV